MGTAILRGLLNKIPRDGTPTIHYSACVRSDESMRRLKSALGEQQDRITCTAGISSFVETAAKSDVVMLGVPPGELSTLSKIDGLATSLRGKITISLLAGTSCDQVLDALAGAGSAEERKQYHVLRVIPSIGAQINDSVTLIARTSHAGEEQQKVCDWLFQQIGGTHNLPENLMDEATAAGAACHALSFVAVDAIVDACVAEGLPRTAAMAIAAQSLRSAAGLLATSMTPESLKEAMSVPKGITINSALELERGQARPAISEAVRNAIRYARSFN